MAVDECLLVMASEDPSSDVWLRFYGWEPPTLSLGYFQNLVDRQTHPPSSHLPIVRRPSGGGAIVHDRELTYSLVVPARHPLAAQPDWMYREVHRSLLFVLDRLSGITARMCDEANATESDDAAFLCFQRRGPGDVVARSADTPSRSPAPWIKICGSAQRRRRGAILQHGSILLAASPAAAELPGLGEITGRTIAAEAFRDLWIESIMSGLGLRYCSAEHSSTAHTSARRLEREKYSSPDWTNRR